MTDTSHSKQPAGYLPALLYALSFRLLLTLYWLARFGGAWVEDDTSRTTPSIQAVFTTGEVAPRAMRVYGAGFLYQVYGTVVSLITGVDIVAIQRWIMPFIGLVVTLVAFAFYFRIFRSPIAAAAAATLLNLQGDFVFTTMRGSHEKLDFILIFVSLLILLLSAQEFESMPERIALAIIYYITILAENTSNVFFASTFTVTLILSFIFWNFLVRFTRQKAPGSSWFLYVGIVSMVFTFMVIFSWYPPARSLVVLTSQLTDRLRLFLFSPTESQAGLLTIVNASWIFPYAWLWLRAFDILLLGAAAIGWLTLLFRLRRSPQGGVISPANNGYFWLLILLPAFALQNFVVIFSDLTGSTGQITNLQVRLIPLTAFLAVPAALYALLNLMKWLRSRSIAYKLANLVLLIVVLFSLLLAVIKGTSEPLLSNNWLLYSPSEYAGVSWLNTYVPRIAPNGAPRLPLVWSDPDGRIARLWLDRFWGPRDNFLPVTTNVKDQFSYVFVSPAVRFISERLQIPFPDLQNMNLIYTNGSTQIYYRPLGSQ